MRPRRRSERLGMGLFGQLQPRAVNVLPSRQTFLIVLRGGQDRAELF